MTRSMKNTVRVAVLGLSGLVMAAPMLAQNGPPPQSDGMGHRGGDMQGRMLKHMTRKLNLTPDQVSQIQTIQADEMSKVQALQADSADQGPGKHKQMKAIHEDGVTRMRAVLTDDQKPKFDAMVAKQKEHMRERREDGGGPPPPPPPAQ